LRGVSFISGLIAQFSVLVDGRVKPNRDVKPKGGRWEATSGTEKALEFRLTPVAAVMMGGISGAGGYTIRDILLAEVPAILRVDFLATAAIIGAIVLVVAEASRRPPTSPPS
jgi:Glycine transporter